MRLDELGYPAGTTFIDAAALFDRLDDQRTRVIDCGPIRTYRGGHIPGATHLWWQDTIEVFNPYYGTLVGPGGRQDLVKRAGISQDSAVVCYDDSGGVYAARLVWMLRYMGFQDARLLVGGRRGWQSAGYQLTTDEPSAPDGAIADIHDESINVQIMDILARLEEPGLVILDTRTAGERRETWNGKLRLGMIPGSVWLPRDAFLADESSLVTAAALREKLELAGVSLSETAEVIVYGLHGTLGCLPYLALLALDEFQVRLFDWGWAQWGTDHQFPVAPLP